MKSAFASIIFLLAALMASAQNKLYITVGDNTLTATLADNSATTRLTGLLADGPVTVAMHDYGGFEKVGSLPWSLPTSDRQLTTSAGDIMLYLGNNIVFFYGSNSWAYTPIGKFDNVNAAELRAFLTGANITVTLSLSPAAGVDSVRADSSVAPVVVDITGRHIDMSSRSLDTLPPGIYIINGRKHIVKQPR